MIEFAFFHSKNKVYSLLIEVFKAYLWRSYQNFQVSYQNYCFSYQTSALSYQNKSFSYQICKFSYQILSPPLSELARQNILLFSYLYLLNRKKLGQNEINISKTRIFNILVSVFNQDRSIALRTLGFRGEQAEPPRHFVLRGLTLCSAARRSRGPSAPFHSCK
ncbi:hypothetical protein F7732_17175 [Bacillus mesophilum]|uniref:Uncharacterized protein n=1 Tax=Bacillus mesophilum TaxID=1071718 RepID=A0A7V7RJD5_9BACI|nr:hypothetical protein F7732_17175 [Bacillus mesophilum]